MAVYKEDFVTIDLATGRLFRSFNNRSIGLGDNNGDVFGFSVERNGTPVDLTGVTVMGYFIRADRTTILVSGEREGNRCWVVLPDSCYAVDGQFTLSIKLVGDSDVATVRVIDGTVIQTVIGPIYDPGQVIPDLEDFRDLVERAEAAADDIERFSISVTLISGTRYRINVANNAS